ncbi:MAG: P-II family nitrogen regulator [Methanomassiliicoccus sp.]|nr:P-II family nitrogen regulator [Methanomassiliicoccus sp.]
MIRAIIRPDHEKDVIDELDRVGLGAMTKLNVFGRGKEKGLMEDPVEWDSSLTKHDEVPKVMLLLAVEDDDLPTVTGIIMRSARTGKIGDGKIFVSDIDLVRTVSTMAAGI